MINNRSTTLAHSPFGSSDCDAGREGGHSSLLLSARVGPKGGRREERPRRRIVDAVFSVVRTGCAWRQLPKDFPLWPTAYRYFTRWHDDGSVECVHDALRGRIREADSPDVEPNPGLTDSQSVRAAGAVPAAAGGFDAGKKVESRKRSIATDTLGLLLAVHVVAASVQDRDDAKRPLPWNRFDPRGVRKAWADQGFAGRLVEWTAQILGRDLEVVREDPGRRGFRLQPKRRAVRRAFSLLTVHRRLARDHETSSARPETMIRRAMTGSMVRRLVRGRPATRPGPRSLSRTGACRLNRGAAEGSPLLSRTQPPAGPTPARCSRMPGADGAMIACMRLRGDPSRWSASRPRVSRPPGSCRGAPRGTRSWRCRVGCGSLRARSAPGGVASSSRTWTACAMNRDPGS